jgi:hypothetical protein
MFTTGKLGVNRSRRMENKTFETLVDDKPLKFIFKSLVRELSSAEAEQLCLKYRGDNIDKTPHGYALEVDLRPAFEKPLDQVEPTCRAVRSDEHAWKNLRLI